IDPATNRYSMGVGGEVFNLNEKLLGSDNTLETGEAYTNHQRLNKEQRNGIIRKEFGNKYSYHKGIESTWVEGADSAVQPSYHYGKRHVEYHADLNAGPANMCPAEISESIEGLTTHKYGDVAEYIQGKHIEGHAGDYALTRTGTTEESRTGDVTRTITGNVTESIENGSVTINNNLMGKTVTEMMPAGDYKTEVTAMNYETMFMVNGERKEMDMSPKFD